MSVLAYRGRQTHTMIRAAYKYSFGSEHQMHVVLDGEPALMAVVWCWSCPVSPRSEVVLCHLVPSSFRSSGVCGKAVRSTTRPLPARAGYRGTCSHTAETSPSRYSKSPLQETPSLSHAHTHTHSSSVPFTVRSVFYTLYCSVSCLLISIFAWTFTGGAEQHTLLLKACLNIHTAVKCFSQHTHYC